MTNSVGLVGVGAMGQALLVRLHAAGRSVKAYDISDNCLAAARAAGAETVASPSEAAKDADFIHVFVRSDDDVIESCLGADGILNGAKAGALVFLHSTIMPETTKRVGIEANEKNVRVLDAPVTAVPRVVAAGDAVFLVGGPADVAADGVPVLEPLGAAVFHFGPLGAGNVAKIAKNFINAAERVVLAETFAMVEAGGLDMKTFLEMASRGNSGSAIAKWDKAFTIEDNHAIPRRASNLLNKDVGLAADLADFYGQDAPVAHGAADTAAKWVAGWASEDG